MSSYLIESKLAKILNAYCVPLIKATLRNPVGRKREICPLIYKACDNLSMWCITYDKNSVSKSDCHDMLSNLLYFFCPLYTERQKGKSPPNNFIPPNSALCDVYIRIVFAECLLLIMIPSHFAWVKTHTKIKTLKSFD